MIELVIIVMVVLSLIYRYLHKNGRFMQERTDYKKYLKQCEHLSDKEIDDAFYNEIIESAVPKTSHFNNLYITPETGGDLRYSLYFKNAYCYADIIDEDGWCHTIYKAHWEEENFDIFKRVMVGDWIIGIIRSKRKKEQKERLHQLNVTKNLTPQQRYP